MSNELTFDNVKNALSQLTINTDEKIKTYQTQTLNNYTTLHNKIKSENERIEKTFNKIKNEHSADAQKAKYVTLSEQILKSIYTYSFWIYIILSIILFILLFYRPLSTFTKAMLFIVIFGFPFYIYYLENITYIICIYLYNIMVSTVYNNGYSNTNIEYSVEATNEILAQTAKSPPLTTS
jgi:ABC-type multidrug transport system fused ATPase/permease subunit